MLLKVLLWKGSYLFGKAQFRPWPLWDIMSQQRKAAQSSGKELACAGQGPFTGMSCNQSLFGSEPLDMMGHDLGKI